MANGATPFDKLDYIELLKAAGVDEQQAKAHADAHARSMHAHMSGSVATKADLETGLARLETRMTVRFYGGLCAAVAAVVALIKLLP